MASEDEKQVISFLLFCLLILLFLLTHFTIVKSDESYLFIFTLSNSSAWTLHPKTLRIEGYNIRIPLFTPVSHGYNRLESIAFQKPLRDDLYFYGANLRGAIVSIDLTPIGDITGIRIGKEGHALVIDGQRLMFKSYTKEWKHKYKLEYGDDGYGVYEDDDDYDEYEIVVTEYFILRDFDPITLKDGTTITINNIGPECVLKMTATEWELYTTYTSSSFLLKNARLKEEKLVDSITFEPHFGKMLEYRLTEPKKRFGER